MNNKLSLAGIVLAAVLGCDKDSSIENTVNESRISDEQVEVNLGDFCPRIPVFSTAPFSISYAQRGINIDPDNNGNVGLLPEPFEIVVNFRCGQDCNENKIYSLGIQGFNETDMPGRLAFTPPELFLQEAFFNAVVYSPRSLAIINARSPTYQFIATRFTNQPDEQIYLFDLSQEILNELSEPIRISLVKPSNDGQWMYRRDLVCMMEREEQVCRYTVENIQGEGFSYPAGTLENQIIMLAFAPNLGECNGLVLNDILVHYLVFGSQFTYEY